MEKETTIIFCLTAQVGVGAHSLAHSHSLSLTHSHSLPHPLGQIELHTHNPVMRQLIDQLQQWNFRLCGVFLLDSQFLIDASKYFSGILVALSTMLSLELPHVNVLSKMDLVDPKSKKNIDRYYCTIHSLYTFQLNFFTDI